MKILLCYRYRPHATATYFERAWQADHELCTVTSPFNEHAGYAGDVDLMTLLTGGRLQPDLVMLIDPAGEFFPRGWEHLMCPTAVYLVDVHINTSHRLALAPFFDYVFVAQRDYMEHLRAAGCSQIYWLPLACDPEIHQTSMLHQMWDVGFVGQVHSPDRGRRLQLLAERFKVNDYRRPYAREEIATVYGQSKIAFNCSLRGDLNMRVFEALASGALLVTDRIPNGQTELFKPGVHLVEYSTDAELLEVVTYYLEHEEERMRIAQAGRELALAQHTYQQRIQFILDTVFASGNPQLGAAVRRMRPAELHAAYSRVFDNYAMLEAMIKELKLARQDGTGVGTVLTQSAWLFTKMLRRALRRSI
jgi:hypothetical protein